MEIIVGCTIISGRYFKGWEIFLPLFFNFYVNSS